MQFSDANIGSGVTLLPSSSIIAVRGSSGSRLIKDPQVIPVTDSTLQDYSSVGGPSAISHITASSEWAINSINSRNAFLATRADSIKLPNTTYHTIGSTITATNQIPLTTQSASYLISGDVNVNVFLPPDGFAARYSEDASKARTADRANIASIQGLNALGYKELGHRTTTVATTGNVGTHLVSLGLSASNYTIISMFMEFVGTFSWSGSDSVSCQSYDLGGTWNAAIQYSMVDAPPTLRVRVIYVRTSGIPL